MFGLSRTLLSKPQVGPVVIFLRWFAKPLKPAEHPASTATTMKAITATMNGNNQNRSVGFREDSSNTPSWNERNLRFLFMLQMVHFTYKEKDIPGRIFSPGWNISLHIDSQRNTDHWTTTTLTQTPAQSIGVYFVRILIKHALHKHNYIQTFSQPSTYRVN